MLRSHFIDGIQRMYNELGGNIENLVNQLYTKVTSEACHKKRF